MALDFVSPGAMAGNAIEEFFLKRQQLARQALLDQLKAEAQTAEIGQRNRELGQRDRQLDQTAREQTLARVERDDARAEANYWKEDASIRQQMEEAPEGAVYAPQDYETAVQHGWGSYFDKAMVPGVVAQGTGADGTLPFTAMGPTTQIQHRGGPRWQERRTAAQERAAIADAAAQARADQAATLEEGKNQRAADADETKRLLAANADETRRLIGTMTAGATASRAAEATAGSQEKRALARDQRIQGRADAITTASEVQRLAEGLKAHKGFNSLFGVYQSAIPTVLRGQQVASAKTVLGSLKSLLSLENLQKFRLYPISDADIKVLQAASTTLDESMDETAAAAELTRIAGAASRVTKALSEGQDRDQILPQSEASEPATGGVVRLVRDEHGRLVRR